MDRSQARPKAKEHGKNRNSSNNSRTNLQLGRRYHPVNHHNSPSSNSNLSKENLNKENLPINKNNNYAFNSSSKSSRSHLRDLVNNRFHRDRPSNLDKENSPTNKSSNSASRSSPRSQLKRMIHLRHIRHTQPHPHMPLPWNGSRMTSVASRLTSKKFIPPVCCPC